MELGPFGQGLHRLPLERAHHRAAEGRTLARGGEAQVLALDDPRTGPPRRPFQPAHAAQHLDDGAGLEGLRPRQPRRGRADPRRPLAGELRRFLQPAGRGRGGDHLAPGGVQPEADAPRPAVHFQAHGHTRHLKSVARGVTFGTRIEHRRS